MKLVISILLLLLCSCSSFKKATGYEPNKSWRVENIQQNTTKCLK